MLHLSPVCIAMHCRHQSIFLFLSNTTSLTTHHTVEAQQAPGREDDPRLTLQTGHRAECGLWEVGRECYIGYIGVMLIYSICVIVHISDIYYTTFMTLLR